MWTPGQDRVENGTLGSVKDIHSEHELTVRTSGAKERDVNVDTREFNDVKLAYAQHVYKAQGLTTDRALVLMGGWQTDRERAYVALTRAREQTNIYTAREDLGHQGLRSDAIERLAETIAESNAQEASITREQAVEHEQAREPDRDREAQEQDRDRDEDRSNTAEAADRDLGFGIE